MKKLRISLAVAALAVASLGAMSFGSKAEVRAKSGEDVLIWLDENGNEISRQTQTQQQADCGTPVVFCADGYQIDEQTGEPTGPAVGHTFKLN